jgi:hypothetical protein
VSLPSDPLVRSAVRARRTAAGPCPDAETLALFAEGDLESAERHTLETHLAACDRCQETLAAFVRAEPGGETAAAPRDGFLTWFMGWRWLVPAASLAAVAVVAVWIGQGPAEEAAQPRPAAAPASPQNADPAMAESVAQALPRDGGAPGTAASSFNAARAETPPAPGRRAPQPADFARQAQNPQGDPARQLEMEAAIAAPPPPPPPPAVLAPQPASPTVPPAPAPAPSPAGAVADARADSARGAREERSVPSETVVAGAAGKARAQEAVTLQAGFADAWRVRDGAIERSIDRGRTWRRAPTPDGQRITAVAPVSSTVCWALTPNTVLRTVNGTTWTEVTLPSPEALASLVAIDAASARVTTATGVVWTTADGGATWRRP